MKNVHIVWLFILSIGAAWAGDEFSAVRCGADVPKALIGKSVRAGSVQAIEGRHKDIGLEHRGADKISKHLYMNEWRICGREYYLLIDGRYIIRDVLLFPDHDKDSPGFTGFCTVNDKERPEIIYAVLAKEVGMNTYPAKTAWVIDEKRRKFEAISVEGMRCPREHIFPGDL